MTFGCQAKTAARIAFIVSGGPPIEAQAVRKISSGEPPWPQTDGSGEIKPISVSSETSSLALGARNKHEMREISASGPVSGNIDWITT